MKNKIVKCDECKSSFYLHSSEMSSLCPECSHYIYGYENCNHSFHNVRCENCYWDRSVSNYIKSLADK